MSTSKILTAGIQNLTEIEFATSLRYQEVGKCFLKVLKGITSILYFLYSCLLFRHKLKLPDKYSFTNYYFLRLIKTNQ